MHRGRGLWRALMDAVLAEARRSGADTIEIGVDSPTSSPATSTKAWASPTGSATWTAR
jgi:hypothetical protein